MYTVSERPCKYDVNHSKAVEHSSLSVLKSKIANSKLNSALQLKWLPPMQCVFLEHVYHTYQLAEEQLQP